MSLSERFTQWYDRQSIEVLFLISVSPLILMGVILIFVTLIFG